MSAQPDDPRYPPPFCEQVGRWAERFVRSDVSTDYADGWRASADAMRSRIVADLEAAGLAPAAAIARAVPPPPPREAETGLDGRGA